MKPSVGDTLLTSSFMIRLTMVVLPALSRPLRPWSEDTNLVVAESYSIKIRISLSFNLAFRRMDSILSNEVSRLTPEHREPRCSCCSCVGFDFPENPAIMQGVCSDSELKASKQILWSRETPAKCRLVQYANRQLHVVTLSSLLFRTCLAYCHFQIPRR